MCANQLYLGEHIKELEQAGIDGLHIDIMDHNFVPNLAISIDTFNQIKATTDLPMEVHLMVNKPREVLSELNYNSNDRIIFHIESDYGNILDYMNTNKANWGIAISPATSFDYIDDKFLKAIECILILTVNPGFAGQQIIESTYDKLKLFIETRGKDFSLEYIIDGHVEENLIKKYNKLGTNNFVGGTTGLYLPGKNIDFIKNIKRLKNVNESIKNISSI